MPKEILAIDNIEQRYTALEWVGVNKFLKGARLVDKQYRVVYNNDYDVKFKNEKVVKVELIRKVPKRMKYELFLLKNLLPYPIYVLRYRCPSTGTEYVSYPPKELAKKGDVLECMAWKQELTKEEYLQNNLES